jgi:hypothetical protein
MEVGEDKIFSNETAREIFNNKQLNAFLKSCLYGPGIAYEAAFIASSAYFNGFIKPGFKYTEVRYLHNEIRHS